MATNQLLPFGMGESPNRIPFEDWNTLPSRLTGFQSGIASSQQFNYILAQGGVAGYILAQLIVEQLAQDATLGSADTLYTNFKSALAKFIPTGIADKSIATAKLADLAVTAAKLAANAVETSKIKDAAVTAAKLASNAVETAKILNGAVTNEKIGEGVIAFNRLAAAAIATQQQAEAGTANDVLMTPLRVAQLLAEQMPPAVPTGMILPFAGTSIPEGFLACNGSNVSRTTYANLFSVIGTRYGAGDGSTTFTLPNLHRRFAEYTTTLSEVGNLVEAGLPNITGYTSGILFGSESEFVGAFLRQGESVNAKDPTGSWNHHYQTVGLDGSRVDSVFGKASSVQPAALRLLPCVKF